MSQSKEDQFTWKSFEASLRAEYGWSDQLPTLGDMPGILKELADEIELGDTPRLKYLCLKIQLATRIVDPIISKDKHERPNGELVEVSTKRSGSYTEIVHHTNNTISIQSSGRRRTDGADRLCSDLEITRELCSDLLQEGVIDKADLKKKLQLLSERIQEEVNDGEDRKDLAENIESAVKHNVEVKPPCSLTIKGLARQIGISETTIRSACDNAKVKRASAGKSRDFKPHEVSQIARQRNKSTRFDNTEKSKWEELLSILGESSLNEPLKARNKK